MDASCTLSGCHQRKTDKALVYTYKARKLGDALSCHRLGDIYAAGELVPKDAALAASLHDRACESGFSGLSETNQIAPFSCIAAGNLLLELDALENRADAVDRFRKACKLDKQRCDFLTAIEGTGEVNGGDEPDGALGYKFGISRSSAKKICTSQGGTPTRGDDGALHCENVEVDALGIVAQILGMRFCAGGDGKEAVCRISVMIDSSIDTVITTFSSIAEKLAAKYGWPSIIIQDVASECVASERAFGKCLSAQTAKLSQTWVWPSKAGIYLKAIALDEGVGIFFAYYSKEDAAKMDAAGL